MKTKRSTTSHKSELLKKMIEKYLMDGEAIGSETLKLSLKMKISSASIRTHFKQLADEGIIYQPHINSGRIPTNEALRNYWREVLDLKSTIEIENTQKLKEASSKFQLFCNLRLDHHLSLNEVINYRDRYSILIFISTSNNKENKGMDKQINKSVEIIIPYNKKVHQLISKMIDCSIEELRKNAKELSLHSLQKSLKIIYEDEERVYNFGFEFLDFIDDLDLFLEIIKGEIHYKYNNEFCLTSSAKNHLMISQNIYCDSMGAKIFIAGKLNRNYKQFYNFLSSPSTGKTFFK